MSNFIAMVYATLKEAGIDTSEMSTEEAVKKFKELNTNENLTKEEIKKNNKPKSLMEVVDEIKSNISKVDVSKIKNAENLQKVTSVMIELQDRYKIKIEGINDGARGKALADVLDNEIGLNPKEFNKKILPRNFKKELEEELQKFNDLKQSDPQLYALNASRIKSREREATIQMKFKRWTYTYETGEPEDAIRHEYGHMVSNKFLGKKTEMPNVQQNAYKRIWLRIYYDAVDSGDIYEVSYYGSTDYREFFSECFTAYDAGYDLPKNIKDFFDGLF